MFAIFEDRSENRNELYEAAFADLNATKRNCISSDGNRSLKTAVFRLERKEHTQ